MITRSRLLKRLERLEQWTYAGNVTPQAIQEAVRVFRDTGEWPTDRHGELTPASALACRLDAFAKAAHRCTFGAPI